MVNGNSNNNNSISNSDDHVTRSSTSTDVVDSFMVTEDILKMEAEKLQVIAPKRMRIEELTRKQQDCPLWFEVHFKRLTGYKSSQILVQKTWTSCLLQRILYHKPFTSIPVAIQWGIDKEPDAHRAYIEFMHVNHHLNLTVEDIGSIVHPQERWIVASPDGKVVDPTSDFSNGILEIKCPYSKRDIPPNQCCEDLWFDCFFGESGEFRLKRDHEFYHQVQVQLVVSSYLYSWCDFCTYTTKGVLVEIIHTDCEWIDKYTYIPILEEYFDNQILPESLYPMHKPPFIL